MIDGVSENLNTGGAACAGDRRKTPERPAVSILIPIYNVERYLRECLDSVIGQTLREIEIICINDGSADSCPAIIAEYAAKDSRIVVLNKKNSGYGDSMNQGLGLARGEYIGIVEPDDYVVPSMFELLYRTASENRCELVKSNFYTFHTHNGNRVIKNEVTTRLNELFRKELTQEDTAAYLQNQCAPLAYWSAIYSAEFLDRHRLRFNPTPGASYQDFGFFHKVLFCVRKWRLIPEHTYYYRQDNPNASMLAKDKYLCIHQEFQSIRAFLAEHGVAEAPLRPILTKLQVEHYFLNYQRVAVPYKWIVIQNIRNEFRELERERKTDYSLLSRFHRFRLRLVLFSPLLFRFLSRLRNGEWQ